MSKRYNYFIDTNNYSFVKPIVGKGKFGVKTDSFFSIIEKLQKDMPDNYLIKPLTLEFEITNNCNQNCLHCGMHANLIKEKVTLTQEQIKKIVSEVSAEKIPSISITGGEPFLVFDRMLELFRECKKENIDICKISTNSFWGNNPKYYFDKMIENDFFNNNLFIPCLMLSIGEQKVPYDNIFNIIDYCLEHFTNSDITLCISSLNAIGEPSKVDEFISEYEKNGKIFPVGKIYLTENYYAHNEKMLENTKRGLNNIDYYLSNCVRCFDQRMGTYVNPRLMMKTNGDIFSCACFNISNELKIGNIFNDGLKGVMNNLNNNRFVNIIARGGIVEFKNLIPREVLLSNFAENFCDACAFCIEWLKNNDNDSN